MTTIVVFLLAYVIIRFSRYCLRDAVRHFVGRV